MKAKLYILFLLVSMIILYLSCAEKKDPFSVSTHPEGWDKVQSANFHGKMVLESVANAQNCRTCHGVDFNGGTSGVSCYNQGCHNIYPHRSEFADSLSNDFHARYIADELSFNTLICQGCHGTDYKGDGLEKKNCYTSGCHNIYPHTAGFTDTASQDFHGKYITNVLNWNKDVCQKCHGTDYRGKGYLKKSCYEDCHVIYPHPPGFADSLSTQFHADTVAVKFQWDLSLCQSCHGSDYSGEGYGNKNCLTCHSQPNGPEACNTCHGSGHNDAPPEDLSGNTLTTAIGVGAHQPHLNDSTWTTAYQQECSLCHLEPSSLSDVGHIDNVPLPAEIHFSLTASDTGVSNPTWDHGNASCQNIYCHGAFEFNKDSSANSWGYVDQFIRGNDPTMTWTLVGTGQDSCGTCHDLPPQGHTAATTCNGCHPRVVDGNFNIIDKNLHINGQKDLF